MRIHIIAELPSDRTLIQAILRATRPQSELEFTPESKTQMKRRGAEPILLEERTFAKFLHHAYAYRAELIVVMVDNDGAEKDPSGVSKARRRIIDGSITRFIARNAERYSDQSPVFAIMVPVESMDYWAHCVKLNISNCGKIRSIEAIELRMMKEIAYGAENIYAGWAIDSEAIQEVIDILEEDLAALRRLRCLPSFADFEAQLPTC